MLLLTTTRDALLAPLQSVSGIVEKRHTLPILSNVLIEKHGEALTLLATDIEIQIKTSTTGNGGEDLAITVGARKLQDILRALPEGRAEHQMVFPADVQQLVTVEVLDPILGFEFVFGDGGDSHVMSPSRFLRTAGAAPAVDRK